MGATSPCFPEFTPEIGKYRWRCAGGFPDVFDALREKKIGVRILLGIVVAVLGIGMLLYLVPADTGTELTGADVVAEVGDQKISMADVQDQLNRVSRNGQIPAAMLPLYAQQVLDQLIYDRQPGTRGGPAGTAGHR